MDPTSLPQPKHLAKAAHNLTIAVENQSLKKAQVTAQKPFVASHLNDALIEEGIDIRTVAKKLKEQFDATCISLEPVLEPLLDNNGNQMYEENTDPNGVVTLTPLMKPILNEKGKPQMKAVIRPDYKTNQFAMNFFKEVLIATKDAENDGSFKDGVKTVATLAEVLKQDSEIMKILQKDRHAGNNEVDAFFEDISP